MDVQTVKYLRSTNPELFQKQSYPDHFVQWFIETGAVNVIGTQMQVDRCKQLIQHIFRVASSHPVGNIVPQSIAGPQIRMPIHPSMAKTGGVFVALPVPYVRMSMHAQLKPSVLAKTSVRLVKFLKTIVSVENWLDFQIFVFMA